jgi:hypothetical protein
MRIEAQVVEGRPPSTVDVPADDGRACRYCLKEWGPERSARGVHVSVHGVDAHGTPQPFPEGIAPSRRSEMCNSCDSKQVENRVRPGMEAVAL